MRTIVAIVIYLLGSGVALAQNQVQVTSLLKALEMAASDKERVDVYVQLASEYILDDSAATTQYASEATQLAGKIDYPEGAVDALRQVATMIMFKTYYEEADSIFHQMLSQAVELKYRKGEADAIMGLSRSYGAQYDHEKAIEYALRSKEICRNIGYKKGEALALVELGYIDRKDGKYATALSYFLSSLEIWQELGGGKELVSNHINLGFIYQQQGNFAQALEEFFAGLKHAEVIGDQRLMGRIYNSIGGLYWIRGQLDLSLEYYLKAHKILEEMQGYSDLVVAAAGVGRVYSKQGQSDLALKYVGKSLELRKELKDSVRLARGHDLMARIYNEAGDEESALYHLQLVLAIVEKVESKALEARARINMGRILAQQNRLSDARDQIFDGLSIAQSIDLWPTIREGAEELALLSERMGDYKAAYEYQVLFKQVADSLQNTQQIRRLTRLESEYEFEQEKQELEAQKQRDELVLQSEIRKQRQFAIIGISAFIAVAVLLSGIVWAYRGKSRANEKLRQLDQFKTRLFANINHDFRTPITLIRGYAHRIQDRKDDYLSKESLRDLESLKSNANMLTEMTNEIHNLRLLEEGKLELDLQSVSLSTYLNREVRMFESLAELSKIDLQFIDETSGEVNVQMDTGYFNKIIYNLMSNAFKFTPNEGAIHVILDEVDGQAKVAFKDTGKGISPKDLPHVFDRFYQSSLNEYRSKEGFGIGLAVVKELIDLHKGTITVTSTKGQGTTFEIIIPLTSEAPLAIEERDIQKVQSLPTKAATETMISTNGRGKHTVLVVDDHEEIRSYLVDLISDVYAAKEAANGQQALKILEKDHVDLIITDLMMPHLDGFGFIEQLKADERLKNLPVMVVSARTTQEDRHRVLDAGVNEFISKPFDPIEFQKRTRNIIESQSHFNGWEQLIENGRTSAALNKGMLEKLNQLILDHVSDPNLTIDLIAAELCASRSKAIRMVKELTGHTPLIYIKIIRMDFVKEAIISGKVKTATEAAKLIGMKNPTQFANQYKKHFGVAAFA